MWKDAISSVNNFMCAHAKFLSERDAISKLNNLKTQMLTFKQANECC